MAKLTKRVKAIKAQIDSTKAYPFDNAIVLIKECATLFRKFQPDLSTNTY